MSTSNVCFYCEIPRDSCYCKPEPVRRGGFTKPSPELLAAFKQEEQTNE